MCSPIKIDPVTPALQHAKTPFWDCASKSLYVTDMSEGTVHCYTPECDSFTTATVGCGRKHSSFIIPIEGTENDFVSNLQSDLIRFTWDGISCKTYNMQVIQKVDPSGATCFNYAKVDAKGRLWAGTIGKNMTDSPLDLKFEEYRAALYMLKDSCNIITLKTCLTASAGMDWSCDKKKFYHIDSNKYQVDMYDYCEETGKICNPCPIFTAKDNEICGTFDGMTTDCEGKLYLANYLGCQVVVIDPSTGQLINKIKIPAREVTGVCWGGPNYDLLFVSTSNTEKAGTYPCAGRIFKICNIGGKGKPGKRACL